MVKRNVNFNPGPAALPLEVLKIVQEELLDYQGSGMSILESSHRAKEFEAINDQAIALVRELLGLGTDYQVLFLGGGASTQFAHGTDELRRRWPDGRLCGYRSNSLPKPEGMPDRSQSTRGVLLQRGEVSPGSRR